MQAPLSEQLPAAPRPSAYTQEEEHSLLGSRGAGGAGGGAVGGGPRSATFSPYYTTGGGGGRGGTDGPDGSRAAASPPAFPSAVDRLPGHTSHSFSTPGQRAIAHWGNSVPGGLLGGAADASSSGLDQLRNEESLEGELSELIAAGFVGEGRTLLSPKGGEKLSSPRRLASSQAAASSPRRANVPTNVPRLPLGAAAPISQEITLAAAAGAAAASRAVAAVAAAALSPDTRHRPNVDALGSGNSHRTTVSKTPAASLASPLGAAPRRQHPQSASALPPYPGHDALSSQPFGLSPMSGTSTAAATPIHAPRSGRSTATATAAFSTSSFPMAAAAGGAGVPMSVVMAEFPGQRQYNHLVQTVKGSRAPEDGVSNFRKEMDEIDSVRNMEGNRRG